MASYDAQINLIVGGLRELDRLSDRLRSIEKQIIDVNRLGVRPQERDPATGRFGADPDRANRAALRRLQDIGQREERLANARRRLIKEQNGELTAQILLQSRLNGAVDLYQRKLEEFGRGGSGAKLTDQLKDQVEQIKRAFDEVTNGGTKNLSLVRSLATELGRVVERQNEINRLSTFQSKAYFQAQQFERQIASLRSQGVNASAFSGVGRQLREYRSATSRGSEFEANDAARKIKEALARIAREFEESVARIKSADKAAASWEQFLSEAAVTALKIKQDQKDAASKWQAFFNGAAAETLEIKQYAKDTAKSWQNFFQDAELEADRLRTRRLSKFAQLRGNPDAYQVEAGPLPAGRAGGPRYFQEVVDQQRQMLEIEKEIAQIREESIRRTSAEEKKRIQEAEKLKRLYGEIGSSLLDAISFGNASSIERAIAQKTQDTIKGLKNSLIRGGLGLGGLGLGKAAFATSGVAAAFAQQTAAQAAGFKGLGMLDPTAAVAASSQAIIQAFSSIGNAVNDALGGVPGVVADMLSAIGQIPDSLGLAAVAAFAFAPAIKNVSQGLYNLGKAAGETKIGASVNQFLTNINPLATAAYGSIEALANGLDQLRGKAIDLQQIATESKNITDQLNSSYRSLPLALPAAGQTSFRGEYSVDPRIGAFTVGGGVRALQKQPITPDVVNTLQQGYQNAEFLADATGKLAARSEEAAAATLMFAEKLGDAAGEADLAKQKVFELARELADAAAAFERFKLDAYAESANAYSRAILNLDKTFKEYVQAGGRGLEIINGQADAYDRAAQAAREYADSIKTGAEFGYKGELPALRPAGYTSQDVRIKNLLDDEKQNAKILSDLEIEYERIYRNYQIDEAQRLLVDELDNVDELLAKRLRADDEYWAYATRNWEQNSRRLKQPVGSMTAAQRIPSFPDLEGAIFDPATLRADRLRRVKEGRKRQEAGKRALSEGLIGGAFPLLFGQGIGASLGGLAGGVGGGLAGGGLGFGLSLIGTALGTALDGVSKAAQDAGKALRYPIQGFEQLKQAGLLAGKQQEFYIQKLIESGKVAEATAAIQNQIISKIGTKGVNDLTALGKSSDELSKAWAEFNLQLQAALAGPLAGLLKWVADILAVGNQVGREVAFQEDVLRGLSEKDRKELKRREAEILKRPGGNAFNEEARRREASALYREFAPKATRPSVSGGLAPEDIERARQASEQLADQIRDAYREGFRIQRQAQDIERSIAENRKKVADDIFRKQQEAARLEIDSARAAAQLRIDAADLAIRKSFSGAEGETATLLGAVREAIKVRASGEADIAQKRRELDVTLADLQKETSDYMYEQAKVRIQTERQIEDYKMEVADYQLRIQRLIQGEQRTEQALVGSGAIGIANIASTNRTAREKALLATIRFAEGTAGPQGYQTMYGGGLFSDMSRHPNRVVTSGNYSSAAAGAYQFMPGTWAGIGGGAMTPQRQDAGALALALRRNANINSMQFDRNFVNKLAPEWASFPTLSGGSYYGQPSKSFETLKAYFDRALAQFSKNQTQMSEIFRLPGQSAQTAQAAGVKEGDRVGYGTPSAQYTRAAQQAIPRPSFGETAIDTSGVTSAQQKLVNLKKQQFDIERQITDLGIDASLFGIREAAQGQSNIIATQNLLNLETQRAQRISKNADLSQNQAAILDKQLQNESQINLIQDYKQQAIAEINKLVTSGAEINGKIVKLNQEQADVYINEIVAGTDTRLMLLRQQLGLETEILKIQQEQQFNQMVTAAERDIALANIGIEFGYAGEAARAFREALDLTGSIEQAQKYASLIQKFERLPGRRIKEFIAESRAALTDTEAVAIRVSQSIGDAVGNSLASGIAGLVEGTTTAREIFATFLKDVGQILIQEGTKMIAMYTAIGIAKIFAGFASAGSSASSVSAPGVNVSPQGTIQPIPGINAATGAYFSDGMSYFANGGMFTNKIVSSPTLFQFADGDAIGTGLMGEAGPEAIMPLKRGPDGSLGVQVADNRAFLSSAAGPDGSIQAASDNPDEMVASTRASIREVERLQENRSQIMNQRIESDRRYERERIEQMASTPGNLNISYESQVINNVEYVTREQAEKMAAQSALRGRELAIGSLQNSVKTRKRVGMS